MNSDQIQQLIDRAYAARGNAYASYSNFEVGAAVTTEDGEIFAGANVENASYGLTICAERVAIFNAITHGKRRIKAVAIVSSDEKPTPPCGACRQVIREFSDPEAIVIMAKSKEKWEKKTIAELLPFAF